MYQYIICLFFACSLLEAHFIEQSPLFYGTYTDNTIIRWEYQSLCDHVFDPRTDEYQWPTHPKGATFDPRAVKPGDKIFVRNVPLFMKTLHQKIANPYIMVTAGEFRDQVKDEQLDYLDDPKIIAWFSVHPCKRTHPKFFPLPLGIYQDKNNYLQCAELAQLFASLRQQPKERLLYMNYGDIKKGKPERAYVTKCLKNEGYCYQAKKRLPFLDYMKEMAQFKFTLSPKGYGPDLYRTWEAMIVGSIPIVGTSHVDGLFENLPVLIIEDWTVITEEFLERKYAEISTKKYPIEKLCVQYWADKIEQVREEFLKELTGTQ